MFLGRIHPKFMHKPCLSAPPATCGDEYADRRRCPEWGLYHAFRSKTIGETTSLARRRRFAGRIFCSSSKYPYALLGCLRCAYNVESFCKPIRQNSLAISCAFILSHITPPLRDLFPLHLIYNMYIYYMYMACSLP